MKVQRLGWFVVILGTLGAAVAPSAFAEGPIKNGLSGKALRRNALTTNPEALRILAHHALDDGLFSPGLEHGYLARQLDDPRARAVMEEIIKCALGSGAKLTYGGATWEGEVGLCRPDPQADPAAPAWGPDGPNPSCQQLVTACLLARTNGLGHAIPLSLRGPPVAHLPARDPVSTETRFREPAGTEDPTEGAPIGSFGGPLCLAGRECGWAPAFVGTCQSGEIRLAIQDPSVCGNTPIRLCRGIHGCYSATSGYPLPAGFPSNDPARLYTVELLDRTGACVGAELRFPCHTELPIGGYYSVMTRPSHAGSGLHPMTPTSPTVVKLAGPGTYPATDAEVFTFREGAFFGNLFEPAALRWHCRVLDGKRTCSPTSSGDGAIETCELGAVARALDTPGGTEPRCVEARTLPYSNVFACYSFAQQQDSQGGGGDDDGVAYLNDRICDEPHAKCFASVPRRCHFSDSATNEAHGAHCDWVGDGRYHECKSPDGITAYLPITTYLNDPCDVLGDSALCSQVRRAFAASTRPLGHVAPGPRGCGGCSLDGADGGLLPASLVAMLALARRGRTRRRARRATRLAPITDGRAA